LDEDVNRAALRAGAIGIRWQAWLEAFRRARRHEQGCRECRREDDGERVRLVPCPQAPPYPPVDEDWG
jgi:hypothetical protein